MKDELEKAVKHCAEKAIKAKDSNDALKFTQAALNAAHTINVVGQK